MAPTQARRSLDDYAFDRKLIGATPFMLAARDGEAAFMRAFAAAGADTSIGLPDGSPPLAVAARGEQHFRTAQTGGVGQPADDPKRAGELDGWKRQGEGSADCHAVLLLLDTLTRSHSPPPDLCQS